MNRRDFLSTGVTASLVTPLLGAVRSKQFEAASQVLDKATSGGQVSAAVLHVIRKEQSFSKYFGAAKSSDAMFLLGSNSKPICVTALMTLFDQGEFKLDDPAKKFLP